MSGSTKRRNWKAEPPVWDQSVWPLSSSLNFPLVPYPKHYRRPLDIPAQFWQPNGDGRWRDDGPLFCHLFPGTDWLILVLPGYLKKDIYWPLEFSSLRGRPARGVVSHGGPANWIYDRSWICLVKNLNPSFLFTLFNYFNLPLAMFE